MSFNSQVRKCRTYIYFLMSQKLLLINKDMNKEVNKHLSIV